MSQAGSSPKKNHVLISDQPVNETARKDDLSFAATAEVLAKAALYTPDPITIGIFGNWGSGKTSLMRLMMNVINVEGLLENTAVPVWFNAWQYEREEHLIIPLLSTIARDIANKEKFWEYISSRDGKQRDELGIADNVFEAAKKGLEILKDGGEKVHNALRSILFGLSMKGKLGIPGISEVKINASVKDMIERYKELNKDIPTQNSLIDRSLYFDAFDKLSRLACDENINKPKIVVFIDDLDRCFPEQAVRLLESIKLVLHQPGFAFVLGIYPEIIEEFVKNKYTKEYHFAPLAGDDQELKQRMGEYLEYFKEYLGKIIQVRHYVPKRNSGEMNEFIEKLLDEAGIKSVFLAGGISPDKLYALIAEVGKYNPREIVRKLNGLIVKYRIRKAENKDKFDLFAMLINEVLGEKKYDSFRSDLDYQPKKDDETTIGQQLANAFKLDDVKNSSSHNLRCATLREKIICEEATTMDFKLQKIEKDEHLCSILITEAGIRWLEDKNYREELTEILKDEKPDDRLPDKGEMHKQPENEFAWPKRELAQVIAEIESNMVSIHAGTFTMGDGLDNNNPPHEVTLSAFEMNATQVTQEQYEALTGKTPSYLHSNFEDKNRPVENVSWEDAMVFCEKLSKEAGRRFTLPTEAQWEYACRAGSTTKYCFGDSDDGLAEYAWYNKNSGGVTHQVGKKKANEWGLYDMHGNVWEWCKDWYESTYYYDKSPNVDPEGPNSARFRVLRGGSNRHEAGTCRSANRGWDSHNNTTGPLGFRVVSSRIS
ncbi:MAG: SUMF1/EgtB/PvdO family nonheme iron enzyme [Deltaproteobacteria bacterium]|nr:SUMF1/EgtB/PvdO family nonheme iron enzyme [Deltaproteobacteria bacterium]